MLLVWLLCFGSEYKIILGLNYLWTKSTSVGKDVDGCYDIRILNGGEASSSMFYAAFVLTTKFT